MVNFVQISHDYGRFTDTDAIVSTSEASLDYVSHEWSGKIQEYTAKSLCMFTGYIVECRGAILLATVQVIDTTCVNRSELLGKGKAQGFVNMHHHSLPDIYEFIVCSIE